MNTTRKTINEQIVEVHQQFDEMYRTEPNKSDALLHMMKVIIQHVMKLEARCYYIEKHILERH